VRQLKNLKNLMNCHAIRSKIHFAKESTLSHHLFSKLKKVTFPAAHIHGYCPLIDEAINVLNPLSEKSDDSILTKQIFPATISQ